MLAVVGVITTQSFALHQPDTGFGCSAIGKPLATFCYCTAILTLLIGACRVWRYQRAMLNGKALTGGFEVNFLIIAFSLVGRLLQCTV